MFYIYEIKYLPLSNFFILSKSNHLTYETHTWITFSEDLTWKVCLCTFNMDFESAYVFPFNYLLANELLKAKLLVWNIE